MAKCVIRELEASRDRGFHATHDPDSRWACRFGHHRSTPGMRLGGLLLRQWRNRRRTERPDRGVA
jgi:hypothetical protein